MLATKGSVDNLRMLADGEATCAFVADDAAAEAAAGASPFTAPVRVSAVASVYDDYLSSSSTSSTCTFRTLATRT